MRGARQWEERPKGILGMSFAQTCWSLKYWEKRGTFVKILVKKVAVNQNTHGPRESDNLYAWILVTRDGEIRQVCQKMFFSTLGVSERTLGSWLAQKKHEQQPSVVASASNVLNINQPVSETDGKVLEDWLLAKQQSNLITAESS
ncbi:hypothetical protein PoB_005120100 [Plakobranchus ocellatus]|uniref:Uncharacterized protein n=1 Tax=Plakobranchus ocellatus TaxID=259542 RepID=A0AAV4BVY9_9GAST|nr:hypothetical protein PoB_005120100 [Plakobranchus ocellatus]